MQRPDLGTDLRVARRSRLGTALSLTTVGGDLETVSGYDNLAQALMLRLGVPMGDLAHLGHPDFGSRLHLLIGRLAGPETTALAQAYVREAIRREPRVAEVVNLSVTPVPYAPDQLSVQLSVKPVGAATPIDLSLTFALAPGPVEAIGNAAAGR